MVSLDPGVQRPTTSKPLGFRHKPAASSLASGAQAAARLPALGRGLRRANQACGLATGPSSRRAQSTSSQLTRPTRRPSRRGTGSTISDANLRVLQRHSSKPAREASCPWLQGCYSRRFLPYVGPPPKPHRQPAATVDACCVGGCAPPSQPANGVHQSDLPGRVPSRAPGGTPGRAPSKAPTRALSTCRAPTSD